MQERRRAGPRPRKSSGSGEGADSALASLRELERTRSRLAPAEDTGNLGADGAAGAPKPPAGRAAARLGR